MNTIDLHMHSHVSDDGEFTTQQLIDMAINNGVKTIAIADHNSVSAYHEDYDLRGIKLIPAIELDCTFLEKDFHILGYGIDVNDPIFKKIEEDIFIQELKASELRLQYVKEKMGLILDEDILKLRGHNGIYVAETLCEAALNKKENKDNPYLKEYYPGGKRSVNPLVNFFWDYFAKGKEAYCEVHYISMEEAINIYKKQNATVIIAHPGNNVKEDKELLNAIIELGIDGLEVYSSYHTPAQIAFYKEVCEKYNLIKSSGSDFHGRTKPAVKMGLCHMPLEEEKILTEWIMNKEM